MTTSSNATTASSTPSLILPEKLGLFKTAWGTIAPEKILAGMTHAEFSLATSSTGEYRARLDSLKAEVSAAIAVRQNADKATSLLLKRVTGGVVADALFGPDSALYRAMGFVRSSERKNGSPVEPTTGTTAPTSSKASRPLLQERVGKAVSAWGEFGPDASFAGMTLEQFKAGVAASVAARDELESARTGYKGGIAQRDDSDKMTRGLMKRVVSAVLSDASYGDDSPLYRAMGYKRASERSRHKKVATPTPAATTVV